VPEVCLLVQSKCGDATEYITSYHTISQQRPKGAGHFSGLRASQLKLLIDAVVQHDDVLVLQTVREAHNRQLDELNSTWESSGVVFCDSSRSPRVSKGPFGGAIIRRCSFDNELVFKSHQARNASVYAPFSIEIKHPPRYKKTRCRFDHHCPNTCSRLGTASTFLFRAGLLV